MQDEQIFLQTLWQGKSLQLVFSKSDARLPQPNLYKFLLQIDNLGLALIVNDPDEIKAQRIELFYVSLAHINFAVILQAGVQREVFLTVGNLIVENEQAATLKYPIVMQAYKPQQQNVSEPMLTVSIVQTDNYNVNKQVQI